MLQQVKIIRTQKVLLDRSYIRRRGLSWLPYERFRVAHTKATKRPPLNLGSKATSVHTVIVTTTAFSASLSQSLLRSSATQELKRPLLASTLTSGITFHLESATKTQNCAGIEMALRFP